MPFTLSHPVAALPLRRWLGPLGSFSALFIGSTAPDLAYFLPVGLSREQTHNVVALFWFCVPVTLVVWALYHSCVRATLCQLLPAYWRARLPADCFSHALPPASMPALIVSALLGATTHLMWDSFTHDTGLPVRLLSPLRRVVGAPDGLTLHVYDLLQHASTLFGLGLLAAWIVRWARATRPAPIPPAPALAWRIAAALCLLAIPTMAAVRAAQATIAIDDSLGSIQLAVSLGLFAGGEALLAVALTLGLVWRMYGRTRAAVL